MWRVLADHGTLWCNLGDAYTSGNRQGHGTREGDKQQTNRGMNGTADPPRAPQPDGLAAGNLLLMPHRVALAAQAEGWIVRNDLTWVKASPMPEALSGWRWEQARCGCVTSNRVLSGIQGYATVEHLEHSGGFTNTPATLAAPDCPTCQGTGRTATPVLRRGSWRHTRATEVVFMLSKSMGYWANSEAVREETSPGTLARFGQGGAPRTAGPKHSERHGGSKLMDWTQQQVNGRNPRSALQPPATPSDALTSLRAWLRTTAPDVLAAYEAAQTNPPSVLRPAASPLGLEHYASFPPSLVEPLIRASCPERVCQCGSPYAPVVSTHVVPQQGLSDPASRHKGLDASNGWQGFPRDSTRSTVHGLAPTCACPPGTPWAPGVCCDPFSGSGTTGLVARALQRHAVLIEASPQYLALARERLGLTALDDWLGTAAVPAPVRYDDLPLFQ
jgi:hypothetical protein